MRADEISANVPFSLYSSLLTLAFAFQKRYKYVPNIKDYPQITSSLRVREESYKIIVLRRFSKLELGQKGKGKTVPQNSAFVCKHKIC